MIGVFRKLARDRTGWSRSWPGRTVVCHRLEQSKTERSKIEVCHKMEMDKIPICRKPERSKIVVCRSSERSKTGRNKKERNMIVACHKLKIGQHMTEQSMKEQKKKKQSMREQDRKEKSMIAAFRTPEQSRIEVVRRMKELSIGLRGISVVRMMTTEHRRKEMNTKAKDVLSVHIRTRMKADNLIQ